MGNVGFRRMFDKYREQLKSGTFYTAVVMAVIFAILAVAIPPSKDLPSGLAGASAAIIAFCTVIMAMTKQTESKALLKPELFITLGTLTSAWLAITHSFNAHVLNPFVLAVLLAYAIISAVFVFGFRSSDGE